MAECNLDGIAEGTEDIYIPERITRFERLETSRRYFQSNGLGLECYLEKMISFMTRCSFMQMRKAIFRNFYVYRGRYGSN